MLSLLDAAKNLLGVFDHLGVGVHLGDAIAELREVIRNQMFSLKESRASATRDQYFALQDLIGKVNQAEYKKMPPRSVMLTSMTASQWISAGGTKEFRILVTFKPAEEEYHYAYHAGDFSIFGQMPVVEEP